MPVGWYNVLHLTTGADCCGAGTRNPAVMLSSRNGKPFLEANVGVTRRIHHNIPLELNKQYSVELVQAAGFFRVKINGKQVWQVHSGSATFRNVKYYWSNPWLHSAGDVATLSLPNIRQGLYLLYLWNFVKSAADQQTLLSVAWMTNTELKECSGYSPQGGVHI